MIIKSSTTLRNNYGLISDLAHEMQEPIYITKNGEGDLVVMSIASFEKYEETIRIRTKLELAEEMRLKGEQAYTVGESKQRLEEIYANDN